MKYSILLTFFFSTFYVFLSFASDRLSTAHYARHDMHEDMSHVHDYLQHTEIPKLTKTERLLYAIGGALIKGCDMTYTFCYKSLFFVRQYVASLKTYLSTHRVQ